jgi:site-specific recombinase XerD
MEGGALPALFAPDAKTAERIVEFFTAQVRNSNTRKAYARAAGSFAAWRSDNGIAALTQVRPIHVAAYIEGLQKEIAAPSVKLHLAPSGCYWTDFVGGSLCLENTSVLLIQLLC